MEWLHGTGLYEFLLLLIGFAVGLGYCAVFTNRDSTDWGDPGDVDEHEQMTREDYSDTSVDDWLEDVPNFLKRQAD